MKVNIGDYPENHNEERKIEIELTRSDIFSLDHTLAIIIHACLVEFRKSNKGYPMELTIEKWNANIDVMIETFRMIKDGEKYEWDNKKDKKMQKGLNLFAKYYFHLWL